MKNLVVWLYRSTV